MYVLQRIIIVISQIEREREIVMVVFVRLLFTPTDDKVHIHTQQSKNII